jgi:hypothetical protein
MYRERADIQCSDSKAYAADIRTADEWMDVTLATKKKKERELGPPPTPSIAMPE